jgi:hypothetical protein
MQFKATTPDEYIKSLPEEKKPVIAELRDVIISNLPKGFLEVMSYGMISYVVPHSIYPDGYHVDIKQPLPFISIASQKNYVALYHMGLYASPQLLSWFKDEFSKHSSTKLDIGKSCIRFKNLNKIPYKIIGELASKISPKEWVAIYKEQIKN